jgi:uncharacterized membrane protein
VQANPTNAKGFPALMPLGINRQAPAVAERQVVIEAPVERVWAVLTDIADWGRWQRGVSEVSVHGPLEPGTSFHWKAGRFGITSTLAEVLPPWRIAWEGKTMGVRVLHAWHLRALGGGTVVETAESFDGPLAVSSRLSCSSC